MTSSNQKFQNLRKVSSQIFVKIIWSMFHQNRPRIVEMRGRDRYTDILTHRRGSPWVNIFSPEMTEYKKNAHLGFFRRKKQSQSEKYFFFELLFSEKHGFRVEKGQTMSERIIFYLNYTENTVFRVQSTTGTMKRCVCALLRPFS